MLPLEVGAKLAGVFAPICTPFAANEDVDPGALRYNLARYAATGIHGYLALGSNGENRSLAEEERRTSSTWSCATGGPGRWSWPAPPTTGSARPSGFLRPRRTWVPTSGWSWRRATSGSR